MVMDDFIYFSFLFLLYFIDYAIILVPIFLPILPLSTQQSPTPSGKPTSLFMSVGHVYKFVGCSIPYTVLYIPMAIL